MAGIDAFTNHLPVQIRFGEHAMRSLAEIVAASGDGPVVVVLDQYLADGNAEIEAALRPLGSGGRHVVRHVKRAGEPTDDDVDAAMAVLLDIEPQTLVAIGGGSAIDTAKAARVCAQARRRFAGLVTDHSEGSFEFRAPTVQLIAIPSTAGTGTEVSGAAVVTGAKTGRKLAIADPQMRAQHALVDPILTQTMPPSVTAHSGIDALAQAIAGMLVRCRTPIGDGIALEAIALIAQALPRAYRDGDDREARAQMACGSLMAGLTMNISDCGAEHALGQAIGGRFGLPHGLTIGLVLAEVLEREAQHAAVRLERIAAALGAPPSATADGSRAIAAIRALLAELEIPVLSAFGVSESDLERLTEMALADNFLAQSEFAWDAAAVRATFDDALSLVER